MVEATQRDGRPALFGALWGLATLFHQAAPKKVWVDELTDYPLTLAACWLLLRPSSPSRLAFLAVIQLIDVFVSSPLRSNHWMFTGFAAGYILIAWGREAWAARDWRLDPTRCFARFAPAIRLSVYVLYFFVVFHKLNDDFLDPTVSCGPVLYERAIEVWPALPQSAAIDWLTIGATLLIEAAIPILLAIRRTRAVGILVAVGFHSALAANPFYVNFSAMLIALMVCFADRGSLDAFRASRIGRSMVGAYARLGGARKPTVVALVFLAAAAAIYADRQHVEAVDLAAQWSYLALALAAMVFCAVAWRAGALSDPRAGIWPLHAGQLGLVVFWALNGTAPYLGLKTETSLAMYSNLRTEGTRPSNHLIIRRPADVLGLQRDLVRVVDGSNSTLRRLERKDQLVTWFEFRSYLARHPELSVRYERYEREWLVLRAGADDELSRPHPWWIRKLLLFRTVDGREQTHCSH
jgi:hypothetical protein